MDRSKVKLFEFQEYEIREHESVTGTSKPLVGQVCETSDGDISCVASWAMVFFATFLIA